MKLGIPQMIYVGMLIMTVGFNLAKHGERRQDHYSFFWALLGAIIDIVLLSYGGFFK